MRVAEAVRVLAGGIVVYVVMAACGSSEPLGRPTAMEDGGSSAGGAEGSGGAGGAAPELEGGSVLDALAPIADALTNPVPDAKAALPPLVATEQCNKTVPIAGSTTTNVYAEHAFPGKTTNDLAAIQIVAHYSATSPTRSILPPGYENTTVTLAIIKDGAVAVQCGGSTSLNFDHVTFILPTL